MVEIINMDNCHCAAVLIVVLARGASTRVPKKNIQVVGGKPVLHYTLDTMLTTKHFADFAVMTESDEVTAVVNAYQGTSKGRIWVLREKDTSDVPVCRKIEQVVAELEEALNHQYKYIICLNADCPTRPDWLIDEVIKVLVETDCDAVETVTQVPITFHPNRLRTIRRVGDCLPMIPTLDHEEFSQFYQPVYAVVGPAFGVSRNHLRRAGWMGNRHMGVHCRPVVVPNDSFMEIDTPEDMERFSDHVLCNNLLKTIGTPSLEERSPS